MSLVGLGLSIAALIFSLTAFISCLRHEQDVMGWVSLCLFAAMAVVLLAVMRQEGRKAEKS